MLASLIKDFLPVSWANIYSNISKIVFEKNFKHFDADVGFERF